MCLLILLCLMLQVVQVVGVCKQCKASLSGGVCGQVKREWEIGRCIHNIYEPDKALPGYMGTGEGVVTENGNFVGELSALLLSCTCRSIRLTLQFCQRPSVSHLGGWIVIHLEQ